MGNGESAGELVNDIGNALRGGLEQQLSYNAQVAQAQMRSDIRQAIARDGTNFVLDELVGKGVGLMQATLISNSDSVRDSVGIIHAMASAENQTGSSFDNLPMAQQTAVLRDALTTNSSSGPTLIDCMREAVVESGDFDGYDGVRQGPSQSPVSIYGSRDVPGGFFSTTANLLDGANAAMASVIDVVGAERAEIGVLGIQVAVGGLPRTALAYAGNYVLGGVKQDLSEKFSGLIAENTFDVRTAAPDRAKDIWTVSKALGEFGVEAAFGVARDVVNNVINSRAVLRAIGSIEAKASEVAGRSFWKVKTEFENIKVFQREDSFDPQLMTAWRDGGKIVTGSNLERMATGRSPIGIDGKPVNLHHMVQSNDSAIAEMTQTFHQENSKGIHINPKTIPSGIDRNAFDGRLSTGWIAQKITDQNSHDTN